MMDSFLTGGNHQQTLHKIEEIRKILQARYYNVSAGIDGVLLAAVCGFPCLLVGPPGVAKSDLIRDFCRLVGVNPQSHEAKERDYFEYLLTQFTEPTELFGSFQLEVLPKTQAQGLRRVETGMLHTCRVAFLDEVFNGSSAILNSLLALMNEGVFHDRGEVKQSKLSMIFGATNGVPDGDGNLAAIYDRFVIRAHLENAEASAETYRDYLIHAGAAQAELKEDAVFRGLLDDINSLIVGYDSIANLGDPNNSFFDWDGPAAASFLENLHFIVELARSKRLGTFSNRRVVKMMRALCMQRLMRATREGTGGDWSLTFEDYQVIWTHFLDTRRPLAGDDLIAMESLREMVPIAESAT